MVKHQLPDLRLIPRANRHAATPVRTTGNALHFLPHTRVIDDLSPRIVIAAPREVFARIERRENRFAKHVRQRLLEQMQQRQRELIDAHIVVFPVRARHVQRTRVAFLARHRTRIVRHHAITIHRIRQTKNRAFPFAGLFQQMRPGDRTVVRRIKADAMNARANGLMQVWQQPTLMRHARQQREIGLRHTKRQIRPIRLAPRGNLLAMLHHHARHATARMHRPPQHVPRRGISVVNAEGDLPGGRCSKRITRPRHFVRLGEIDGVGESVHPDIVPWRICATTPACHS